MPIVKTPKGTIRFPEGTSEADMNEAISQLMGPEGSAIGRFAESAWEQVNPVAAVQGLYQMARHPIDTAGMIASESASKGREAMTAAQAGEYGKAATAAVGAIPLVGPAIEKGITQFESGDIAGGLGTAAGLALPYTRPAKLARMGGLAVAREVAPGLAAKAATRLEKIAESKVAKVMSPEVGANKTRIAGDAAKVAPEVLQRGLTNVWSREGLHENVKVWLDKAGNDLDAAAEARPKWKDFDTEELVAKLKEKKADIQAEPIEASKWPRRVDEETGAPIIEPYGQAVASAPISARVARINRAIAEVQALGPTARYEALRKLRMGWDQEAKVKYSPAVTPDYVKNLAKSEGAADVTGTLREFLASKDPATAKANAEWSLAKKADSVLKAVEETERARPTVGRKIMSRVAGSIIGSKIAGLVGAFVGYGIAPAAEISIGMGVTNRLKVGTTLDNLAKALRRGRASEVEFYTRQLQRSLAQAGVQVENIQELQSEKK